MGYAQLNAPDYLIQTDASGNGSFTLTANAGATSETRVNFAVFN